MSRKSSYNSFANCKVVIFIKITLRLKDKRTLKLDRGGADGGKKAHPSAQLYIVAKEKYRENAGAGVSRRRGGRDSNARRDV